MCANRSKKRRRKNVLAKKKIKKSRANNLRSLKKRKTKEERRTYTNEDATRVVLFLTSLDAAKRLSARLLLVPFLNQNYRRQRWNREKYVVDVINIISSRYFHATQSFRVVTYRALRRVQL